jgi:hypothetical protein
MEVATALVLRVAQVVEPAMFDTRQTLLFTEKSSRQVVVELIVGTGQALVRCVLKMVEVAAIPYPALEVLPTVGSVRDVITLILPLVVLGQPGETGQSLALGVVDRQGHISSAAAAALELTVRVVQAVEAVCTAEAAGAVAAALGAPATMLTTLVVSPRSARLGMDM